MTEEKTRGNKYSNKYFLDLSKRSYYKSHIKKIKILRRVCNRGLEYYLEWNEELLPIIIYFPRPNLPWPTINFS